MTLRSIPGELQHERPFVCPWCGARFATRLSEAGTPVSSSPERHWLDYPECGRNRGVNSPLVKG